MENYRFIANSQRDCAIYYALKFNAYEQDKPEFPTLDDFSKTEYKKLLLPGYLGDIVQSNVNRLYDGMFGMMSRTELTRRAKLVDYNVTWNKIWFFVYRKL